MYINKEGGIFMRQLTYFTLPNNGKPGLAFRALLPTIFLESLQSRRVFKTAALAT